MAAYFTVNDQCNGCLACVHNCPATALDVTDEVGLRKIYHNMTRCARCGNCWRVCPQDAIVFKSLLENKWELVTELDMVHCRVCGEPLYTADFAGTLCEKLGQPVDPLCPRHMEGAAGMARAHFFPGRSNT